MAHGDIADEKERAHDGSSHSYVDDTTEILILQLQTRWNSLYHSVWPLARAAATARVREGPPELRREAPACDAAARWAVNQSQESASPVRRGRSAAEAAATAASIRHRVAASSRRHAAERALGDGLHARRAGDRPARAGLHARRRLHARVRRARGGALVWRDLTPNADPEIMSVR
jgi:hypothetical protein